MLDVSVTVDTNLRFGGRIGKYPWLVLQRVKVSAHFWDWFKHARVVQLAPHCKQRE